VNVDEMQRKLSQKAEKEIEHQFENLYSLLCNEDWLRVAHKHVNTNRGRETAGIDGESMCTFNKDLEVNLGKLREQLKAKTFEPLPVRRVYIPKANGKKRPLGIPGIRDRIVQEALRMILEPIWEADFSVHSYGFRPNRSTYDAISYIGNRLTGTSGKSYQWVIEGDITSYFDTIPHRRLIKAIKKRVADRDIRDLLWKFLRAGVMYQDKFCETLTGTPQGGIISPLLANIYLHALDRYMESNYLTLTKAVRAHRREKGKANFLYVRYADDFVVLCNGTKAQAHEMKEELSNVLNQMGLMLSEEKTKVTHITEGFDFLGYRIIRSIGQNGKMVPKIHTPEKAIKRFRHEMRRVFNHSSISDSVNAKITAANRVIRGWCQHYQATSNPSATFDKVRPEVFWGMADWLGRKYEAKQSAIMERFRQGDTLGTSTEKLIMPSISMFKAKRHQVKIRHNPYTGSEQITRELLFSWDGLWDGTETRQGWRDLREEIMALKGTICAIQGPDCISRGKPLHPSEVEIDHIIPRSRFRDPRAADLPNNQQVVCTPCHRAKTKTDSKVLSRMQR